MDIRKEKIILDYLADGEYHNITNLSKEIKMPRASLIRYIDVLVEQELIVKTRGVVILKEKSSEQQTSDKRTKNLSTKQAIAKKAAKYIKDKDIIFIDSGSTTLQLINYIKDKDIIIYTNNVTLLDLVPADNFKPMVYMVPGRLYKQTSSIVGALVTNFIKDVYIDIAFLGTNAVNGKDFLTTNQHEQTIKKTLAKTAGRTIVMYEKSKEKQENNYRFATASAKVKGVTE